MPPRGSAQLLLLFPRSHARRLWTLGAIAGGAAAAGLLLAVGPFPLPTPAELAQVVRESAWDRALAGAPEQVSWPWDGAPAAPKAKVLRLGLSASVVDEAQRSVEQAAHKPLPSAAGEAPRQPGAMPREIAIGESITVTTASGDSRVYRVIGPRVVDPHLAESDSDATGGEAAQDACVPLDPLLASSLKLVIQAITADAPAPEPGQEQKL